jgi:hypothetical protein
LDPDSKILWIRVRIEEKCWIRIRIEEKCWFRIRIEEKCWIRIDSIRIHNPANKNVGVAIGSNMSHWHVKICLIVPLNVTIFEREKNHIHCISHPMNIGSAFHQFQGPTRRETLYSKS